MANDSSDGADFSMPEILDEGFSFGVYLHNRNILFRSPFRSHAAAYIAGYAQGQQDARAPESDSKGRDTHSG